MGQNVKVFDCVVFDVDYGTVSFNMKDISI